MLSTINTTPSADQIEYGVLGQVRQIWLDALKAGYRERQEVWEPGAKECLDFFLGNHSYVFDMLKTKDSMYMTANPDADGKPPRQPAVRIYDNVAAKFVNVYLPYLLGSGTENKRIVTPHKTYFPPPEYYGLQPVTPDMVMQAQASGNRQAMAQLQQMYMAFQQYQQAAQQDQQQQLQREFNAAMIERLLQYTVGEMGFAEEERLAVTEALVLGGGVLWTEIAELPSPNPGQKSRLPMTTFVPMEDVIFDPTARRLKDCKWVARRCIKPTWQVAAEYGVPEEDLDATIASVTAEESYQCLTVRSGIDERKHSALKDLFVYWKVYSRCGIGARLRGLDSRDPDLVQFDSLFSDYTFLVVAEGCKYPLNLGPQVRSTAVQLAGQRQQMQPMYDQMAMAYGGQLPPGMQPPPDPADAFRIATNWPTPYWLDLNSPWPFWMVSFHERTGSPYPIPPLEFALSYMKFLVWCISFIADKTIRSMRDFWLCPDDVAEALVEAIKKESDEPIIRIKATEWGDKTVKDFVQLLEAPQVKKDIFTIYEFFENKFQQQTGMNDLMQAQMSRQMRSATEAKVISDASQLRPQDMRARVLGAESQVAKKEAIASRNALTGQDLLFLFGPAGAQAWDQTVRTADIVSIAREANYEVEAGPGPKLDPDGLRERSQHLEQFVIPTLLQLYQATGMAPQLNKVLAAWAKSWQIDPDDVAFPDMQAQMQMQQQQQQQMEQQQQQHGQEMDRQRIEQDKKKTDAQVKAANRRPAPARKAG